MTTDDESDASKVGLDRFTERVVEAVRAPAAQAVGLAMGAVAVAFFVVTAVRAWRDAAPILGELDWLTVSAALIAFVWFQCLATMSLAAMGANAPARIWAAAQLTKYLPFPGATAMGMLGSSVRYGHSPRVAVVLLIRHTVLLIGAGMAVGSFALAQALPIENAALRMTVVGLAALGGLGLSWVAVPGAGLRRVASVAVGLGAWAGLVVGLYVAFPATLAPSLAAVSAYAAAWVAGLLVLPVPAGLGIREATLLFLLTPVTGAEGAIAFAIATRVLHAIADGALVAVFAYRGPVSRNGSGPRSRSA